MASGFIILRDGRCLSVRHAIHDSVLRSIAAAIEDDNLRAWLTTQVPADGDIDIGYAFVRAGSGEHVTRELDTRGFTESNRRSFELAVAEAEPIAGPRARLEDVAFALKRLREMVRLCDEGRPPLELSDWTIEARPCEERIGPGWTEST